MIRLLDFLLVLYLVYQSGILPVGNSHITETGEKGGNVTLLCEFKDHNISDFELRDQTGNTVDLDENYNSRFVKKEPCDVIIKDLSFSDAGKYTLTVYYHDGQPVQKSKIKEYHLHIHGNISVKTGEQLKLDVLLFSVVKLEKNSSGEWTKVWTRGHGVWSDRLIDRDGNLIINNFTVTDAGTYRALDSEGEILITITVTESSPESGSKGGQRNTNNDTEQQKNLHFKVGVLVGVVLLVVVVVVVGVTLIIYIRRRYQQRRRQHQQQANNQHDEMVPMNNPEQEAPAEH